MSIPGSMSRSASGIGCQTTGGLRPHARGGSTTSRPVCLSAKCAGIARRQLLFLLIQITVLLPSCSRPIPCAPLIENSDSSMAAIRGPLEDFRLRQRKPRSIVIIA